MHFVRLGHASSARADSSSAARPPTKTRTTKFTFLIVYLDRWCLLGHLSIIGPALAGHCPAFGVFGNAGEICLRSRYSMNTCTTVNCLALGVRKNKHFRLAGSHSWVQGHDQSTWWTNDMDVTWWLIICIYCKLNKLLLNESKHFVEQHFECSPGLFSTRDDLVWRKIVWVAVVSQL